MWYARTRKATWKAVEMRSNACKNEEFQQNAGLRLVDQTMVDCVQGEFEAIGNTKLIKNVMQVILDGLLADKEFFADFLVTVPLRDKLDNFLFSIAEQRFFAARSAIG